MNESARVLVVDDEPFVAFSVTSILEDYDVEAEVVGSGEEALEIASVSTYDVALVDLRLPAMQGDELIEKLHKAHPHMRFIIHTGSTWFKLTDNLKAAGVRREHLLYKPVVNLVDIVHAVLELAGKTA